MQVKICGITQPDQGRAIAELGATAIGFMCVAQSPRYLSPDRIRGIASNLPSAVLRVGVFLDASLDDITATVEQAGLNAVQLHGQESPLFCQQLRSVLPQVEIIKALRVRCAETLQQADRYQEVVDALLLDAYHPTLAGGTGKTLDWQLLQTFRPNCPWLLAGGITPENVLDAVQQARPDGIDLSSGVERSPGDKDLARVKQLFQQLSNSTVLQTKL